MPLVADGGALGGEQAVVFTVEPREGRRDVGDVAGAAARRRRVEVERLAAGLHQLRRRVRGVRVVVDHAAQGGLPLGRGDGVGDLGGVAADEVVSSADR
ncbi:hypothetical protein [Saccharothrix sp.]|uniref:hypothetical protein n=1 Tax=Saccharothrix sp. TaxID=1873460 RepID=UPI0028122BB8|nr:hypothetical protein [Saccharothrix sp.]